MNFVNNALSAKNVRIHGMSSSKWTTKDKITQYKGLVTLYKRDRQITEVDNAVASKRQYKSLQSLRKDIDNDRQKLDNMICGDKQQLRNTLADHRELQMAYKNSDPKKVMENMQQLNFTKRKVFDKLTYQLKLKSQLLTDLKCEKALLEDRIKYQSFDKLEQEKMAQIITGKVQEALLKKEAALAIQQYYHEIINVMKKDALYFDGIVSTIASDHYYQCRCVLNAAKQGQLATEYKNDREQEYETLEKAVLQDMKTQKTDLETVRGQAEKLQSNLKQLLRRDSDLTLCILKIEDSPDFVKLNEDVKNIETTLQFLKETTLSPTFEAIFPNLQEQRRQKKRLTYLVNKCERNRETLQNKVDHAELMSQMLQNSMVETTGEYRKNKKELLERIKAEEENREKCEKKVTAKCNRIAQVRLSLRQLQQLCKPLKQSADEPEIDEKPQAHGIVGPSSSALEIIVPEGDETDGMEIIRQLTPKLTFLMTQAKETLDASSTNAAYKYYEALMKERGLGPDPLAIKPNEALLEEFTTEVSHLLTREDIKRISDEIVAANTHDDDMVPMMPIKKKRKFK